MKAALKRLWRAYRKAGEFMGAVVSRVAMAFIFYAVLAPAGLLLRLLGRDPLNLKKKPSKDGGYWNPLPPVDDKSSYDHLF